MPAGKNQTPWIVYISLAIVLFALLFFFVIRPTILGYIAYQTANDLDYSVEELGEGISGLRSDLDRAQTNLSVCHDFSAKMVDSLSGISRDLADCRHELALAQESLGDTEEECQASLEDLNKACDQQEGELEDDLEVAQEELSDLRQEYDAVIQNAARSLCCREKVDNPDIDSFSIENDRIVCEEDGENLLSCFT